MTDLESPRKNNDCYFYYYSTCTKGDDCTFRHEPTALGCETTCSFWKEGKCINVHCNFRHMELRKNRKTIPCYWESQPGGCKKPHCPFMHASKSITEEAETTDFKSTDNKSDICINKTNQVENNFGSPVVDPLVVNFEEESDNESAPTQSPVKTQRIVKVKTLEEIKLERIQAESAAYYSYPVIEEIDVQKEQDEVDFIRKRIMKRILTKQEETEPQNTSEKFEILSLDEIRKRKRQVIDEQEATTTTKNMEVIEKTEGTTKKQKLNIIKHIPALNTVTIKTLEEIRAERAKRFGTLNKRKMEEALPTGRIKIKKKLISIDNNSDSEVSSTSVIDVDTIRLNIENSPEVINRLLEPDISRTHETLEEAQNDRKLINVISNVEKTNLSNIKSISRIETKLDDIHTSTRPEFSNIASLGDHEEADLLINKVTQIKSENVRTSSKVEEKLLEEVEETDLVRESIMKFESSKMDDFLLEGDDFESSSVSLRAEEDILNDIDNLLNE